MKKVEDKTEQQKMHKDFWDRCKKAMDSEFYMETMLMEYAAMESRLESLLGILGSPCNKFIDDSCRKKVQISHRTECLSKIYGENNLITNKSKLDKKFFQKLEKWISKRNEYIHGLYKNELKYKSRIKNLKKVSEEGLEYCRLLYNETTRIRRLKNKTPEFFLFNNICSSTKCNLNNK